MSKKVDAIFEKWAVSPSQLIKGVNKGLKGGKFNRFRPNKNSIMPDEMLGPHAVTKSDVPKAKKEFSTSLKEYGMDINSPMGKEQWETYSKNLDKANSIARNKPAIVTPKKEKTQKILKENLGIDISGKKTHKGLNSVLLAHERDELALAGKAHKSFKGFGHNSPEVILREHNNIKTLKGGGDTKKILKDVRGLAEADVLKSITGGKFIYGESPRLSRHARKRITQLAEEKLSA